MFHHSDMVGWRIRQCHIHNLCLGILAGIHRCSSPSSCDTLHRSCMALTRTHLSQSHSNCHQILADKYTNGSCWYPCMIRHCNKGWRCWFLSVQQPLSSQPCWHHTGRQSSPGDTYSGTGWRSVHTNHHSYMATGYTNQQSSEIKQVAGRYFSET